MYAHGMSIHLLQGLVACCAGVLLTFSAGGQVVLHPRRPRGSYIVVGMKQYSFRKNLMKPRKSQALTSVLGNNTHQSSFTADLSKVYHRFLH